MKKIIIYFILFFDSVFCFSQAPDIEWQNTLGGSNEDYLHTAQKTFDGGYIIGGMSKSEISGDKTEVNKGLFDYWIIKLDSVGLIQWQKTIGGNYNDELNSIQQTNDGGYILGGWSESDISGDKTEASWINPLGYNSVDYWVLKLDSSGNIEWQKVFGGSGQDYLRSIQQTTDAGYILGGDSDSNISGDKTESSYGYSDFWVVKIDSVGNLQWQNTIGADSIDVLYSVIQTSDNNYIGGGFSLSGISGDKTDDSNGSFDYWVIKIDSFGNIIWDKTIGGDDSDRLFSIIENSDGNYLLAGDSHSDISGDKTSPNIGSSDFWLLLIDITGNIIWQKTIGGSSTEEIPFIRQTFSSSYVFAGSSASGISGDKTDPLIGVGDYWVLKLDDLGAINWQKTIGGNLVDECFGLIQSDDGGYLVSGYSESGISGNKTEPSIGALDYWVVKLFPDCPELQETCNGLDDDCDGDIDEGLAFNLYYLDADGDNFGNILIDTFACSLIEGYISDSTDCDDSNPYIYPGAPEILNAIDDNCNDTIDEGLVEIQNLVAPDFIIYPNPNKGNFEINFQNLSAEKIEIEVINSIGEKIYFNQFFSQNQINIYLPDSFSGLANLIVNDGNKIYCNSLFVIK